MHKTTRSKRTPSRSRYIEEPTDWTYSRTKCTNHKTQIVMKQIFILLFISLATITLTSCSNSAERAIEKVQAFEKDILVLEARNLEHTSEQIDNRLEQIGFYD